MEGLLSSASANEVEVKEEKKVVILELIVKKAISAEKSLDLLYKQLSLANAEQK